MKKTSQKASGLVVGSQSFVQVFFVPGSFVVLLQIGKFENTQRR
jgi:hypothetical protein